MKAIALNCLGRAKNDNLSKFYKITNLIWVSLSLTYRTLGVTSYPDCNFRNPCVKLSSVIARAYTLFVQKKEIDSKNCGKLDWINLEFSLFHFELGCKVKSIMKRKVVNAWHGFNSLTSNDNIAGNGRTSV